METLAKTDLPELLPSDWTTVRFDDLFSVQQGKQVSKKNRRGDNQRPFLRTKNVLWGHLDLTDLDKMNFTEAEEERLCLQPGDLLVCEGGDIGRTAIWRNRHEPCYYQNHLHRARAKDTNKVYPEFVLFWLWYAFEIGHVYFGRGNVTTIPNLSQSKLSELPLPLPSIDEQQKIASILGLLQRAIAQQDRLIAITNELKRTVLYYVFRHGLRGEPEKETEIGPLPLSWKVSKIQQLVDMGLIAKPMDGNHGNLHPKSDDFVRDGIPFVMASDLENGTINFSTCAYLRKEQADRLQKGFSNEGDVLISHKATIGITAIVPKVHDYVMLTPQVTYYRVLDHGALSNLYLKAFFESDAFQQEFAKVARDGSTRSYIGITKQRDLFVALPDLNEQLEIGNCAALLQHKIVLLTRRRSLLSDLFHTVLHQLMTAQMRVNDLDLGELESAMAA